MLNVCMIGHGMMGLWHSEALLKHPDARLHTVVGRARPPGEERGPTSGRRGESTAEFAARFGYQKWSTDVSEALGDPEVDIVVIAGPSETHADMALAALAHGKHTLVEIPIAMNLEGSERVVATAKERDLTLGVVHPMRFRAEHRQVTDRVGAGKERVTHVHGRFFIHRLENVGATGLQRSWTDNILWHHMTHLVDVGLWTVSGGDMTTTEDRLRNVYSFYPAVDPRTGIPMEVVLVAETDDDQAVLATGSYYAHWRIYDVLTVGDRDMYHLDELRSTQRTAAGERQIPSEEENAKLIAPDFVDAVVQRRDPLVPGWSVLPTMRVLHRAQEQWDATYGKQVLPGRPVV